MTQKTYYPRGTCSRQINVTVDQGIVKSVNFIGGCSGNTQGVSRLVEGRPARDCIALLRGISCGGKPTSCPDQLSYALEEALKEDEAKA